MAKSASEVEEKTGYHKVLGLSGLTFASVAGVIGSGWLLGAITSANYAGPAAILSWIIGGIFILGIAIPEIEVASLAPSSGALARWPQLTHGKMASFLMGWMLFFSYATTPPIEAEAALQYSASYIPNVYNTSTGLLTTRGLVLGVLLLILFYFLNYFGIKLFSRVNNVITVLKVLVPLITIVALFTVGFHGHNFTDPRYGGFMPYGWVGVFSAVSLGGVAFAYEGFRQAIDLSGEARNPKRDVPLALIFTVFGTMLIYVLLQVVFIGAVRGSELTHGWAHLILASPFAHLALALNLGWLAIILYADAIYSPLGTGFVYFTTSSRVLWALPQNGVAPKSLARMHPRHGVPIVGMIITLIVGALTLLPFPAWSALVGVVTSISVVTYMSVGVFAMVLRRTVPTMARIKIGGMKVFAPIAFLFGSLIWYWTGWPIDLWIGAIFFAGFLGFLIYAVRTKSSWTDIKAGAWMVALGLFITLMSYIGSSDFGGKNYIPYPWDNVVVLAGSLVFYFWGVHSGFVTDALKQFIADHDAQTASPPS
ncbi:MAG: aspartate:proton symporter [Sulfobacillus acidophilus]|uniref:Aspartate:proton symporter n=1 Tax=Sulfobacillus acidophilus TaxID=53633 RepID=A0A2T2WJT1_9FIRM|nr:MAG: aspartate:proton symporter [Sulfobacillus acidophilus]